MTTIDLRQLDKQRIADSFKASAATYEKHAVVQKEISRQLINMLQGCESINSSRVLEIGCCTGILTELLVGIRKIDTLYLNDIVPEFCAATGERIATRVGRVQSMPGDIEKCPLPDNLDLIISSATFQWMADLPALFRKIHHALAGEGSVVFSIFGPGTMGEISALTGQGLHYHSREKLIGMLEDYFRITSLRSETRQLHFPTVRAVLQHIRQTGVGGVGRGSRLPGRFKEFAGQYQRRFASDKGLLLTYASTFVVAGKK